MFTAIYYADNRQLPKLRALLLKQRLEWQETPAILNGRDAVHIYVGDTSKKVKQVRKKPAIKHIAYSSKRRLTFVQIKQRAIDETNYRLAMPFSSELLKGELTI